MSDEILKTSKDGKLRVVLKEDSETPNPRGEFDNVTHVATVPNRRFHNIDPTDGPLGHVWANLDQDSRVERFVRTVRMLGGVALHDSPGEGSEAVWYLLPDDMAAVQDPVKALEADRDEYRAWAAGEVYGYEVEELKVWVEESGREDETRARRETWEPTGESCWGLIGLGYARETALTTFEEYLKGA